MTDATTVYDTGAGTLADLVNDALGGNTYTYYDGSLVHTRRNEGVVPTYLVNREGSVHLFAPEAAEWIALATKVFEKNDDVSYGLIAAVFARAAIAWGETPTALENTQKAYADAGEDFSKWIAALAEQGVGLPYAATKLAGIKPTSIFTGFKEKPAEEEKPAKAEKKNKKDSGDGKKKKKKDK